MNDGWMYGHIHTAGVWINLVRLPILLLVVSRTGKRNTSLPAFMPENLVSRDGLILYIRHRVSPGFIGSRHCVPMAFTAESPPAQGQ